MTKEVIEVGDTIEWCDEQFEVLEIYQSGDMGKVKQGNAITRNFKFNFHGEESKIIKKGDSEK